MAELKKSIFCSKCQTVTTHQGSVDMNGEYVFTCTNVLDEVDCDRFVKYPASTTKEELNELLAVHEEANKGQVSVEAQEKTLEEMTADEEVAEEEDE